MDESGGSTASSLWNQNSEPKSEIDSGMMPPPSLPPITVRRASLVSNMTNDQISPPICGLKAELMDENSQNSMGSDQNSRDRFPSSNENSIDNSMYSLDKRRDSAIDMMEENSNMSIIVNDNTMDVSSLRMNQFNNSHIDILSNADDLKVIDLCVKQEQIVAQIQNLVQNNQNQILSNSVNQMNTQLDNSSMYNTNQTNSNAVFGSHMISTTSTTTSPTIYESLCRETGVNRMNQILEMPQTHQSNDIESNSSDSMMGSPTSSNRSPHAQDIILNSQSSVLNGNDNLQSVLPPSSTNPQSQHSISPDIILNPSVSPSMMCQAVTDANLLSPQGALSNPILNTLPNIPTISTIPTITQTTQDAILNNLIPSVISQPSESQQMHMSCKMTPVAVKNMYLKAANEILTSQPTESTINALISMDQTMYNETQSNVGNVSQNNMQTMSSMYNGQDQMTNHQLMTATMVTTAQNNLAAQQEAENVMQMNNVSMSLLNQVVNEQQMQRVQEELIRVTTNSLV